MGPFRAWRDGIRRVTSAPAIAIAAWMLTSLVSLPLVVLMRADIADSLGNRLAAGQAARGMSYEWMQDFADQATPLGATLRPSIVGAGAVLDNMSAYVDNVRRPAAVAAASGVYVLLWIFLTGGAIDRYARGRVSGGRGFFAACGVYFFRLFRLAIVTAIVYGVLFGALHPWMFGTLYPRLIRGIDVERTTFFIRAGLYVVFGVLLAAANVVSDYTKVRAVVEDRRSMLVAIAASCRFIRKHTGAALGVYVLNVIAFAMTLAVYASIAPSAGGIGLMVWPGFVIGQAYIVGRLCVKLLFWASETALFQRVSGG
jgi:hypothetical protein